MARGKLPVLLPAVLPVALLLPDPVPAPAAPPDPPPFFTPASAVIPALADVRTLPGRARHLRYLSLYNVAPAGLAGAGKTAAFVLNSLSRAGVLYPPVPLAGGRLLRVDLSLYRIDPDAWDDLGRKGSGRDPFPDPYFHLEAEVEQEYGYHAPGGGWVTTRTAKVAKVLQAPWLPRREAAELVALTHTDFPVLRLDWFCYFGLLEPRYHAFLGLDDTEKSFDALVGAEKVGADEEAVELGSVVLDSEVATNNRAPFRIATRKRHGRGYKWDSNDFDKSLKQADILQDPSAIKPLASELIGSLPDGLQTYFVVDKARKRLDRAGVEFAHDGRNGFRSVEVEIRNCFCCHAEGIIAVDDDVRAYAQGDIALALRDLGKKDRKKAAFVADRYFSAAIGELVASDQASYAAAVKSCNGLAPAANALALRQMLLSYERNRTLADLPAETGYPPAVVKAVLERSAPAGLDHSAVGVLTRKGRVRFDQFAAKGFGQLETLLSRVPADTPPPAARRKKDPVATAAGGE
jgi:hypothetical protein